MLLRSFSETDVPWSSEGFTDTSSPLLFRIDVIITPMLLVHQSGGLHGFGYRREDKKTGDISFMKRVVCDQNATAVREEEHAALLNVVIPSLREMHEKAIEKGEKIVPLKFFTLSAKSAPEFAAAAAAEA